MLPARLFADAALTFLVNCLQEYLSKGKDGFDVFKVHHDCTNTCRDAPGWLADEWGAARLHGHSIAVF